MHHVVHQCDLGEKVMGLIPGFNIVLCLQILSEFSG